MHRATLVALCLLTAGCATGPDSRTGLEASAASTARVALEVVPDIESRVAQFAPTELRADLSVLSAEDREALGHLVAAARLMDDIFLRQAWVGNPELAARLAGWDAPLAEPARTYFRINYGPWDRLAERQPFLGSLAHPPGAGFYPEDMSREEFESFVAAHPEQAEALRSLHTVVRRDQAGGLVAIPYSTEYRDLLVPAADHLRRAAAATANPSLAHFLELRADAFGSDDYYASDVAWMDLDGALEVTIGPYEVYEDGLFGYKTAFTAFVTVDAPEESAKLAGYKAQLPWLERNLPIPDEHKNLDRGSESPIRVVDLVTTGGDTRAGVQTIAFNLPNDERVREAKGSKKVLLRNIIRAKYDQILVPIAARTLALEQRDELSFDAFFNEVLHHELSHGLGPGRIRVDGRETEVRLELRDLYSTLEEAKADVAGVYDILALVDRGEMPRELLDTLPPTYLAGLFRSARFGVHEAHGQGVIAQFNYLTEKGALEVTPAGDYRILRERFPDAIRELLHDLLMLQATGDYEGATEFLARYGHPTPELLAAISRLEDVPVDIRPVYPQAEELTGS